MTGVPTVHEAASERLASPWSGWQGRLLFTLAAVAVYRIGLVIPLPGVDRQSLADALADSPLLDVYNMFVGGGLGKPAVFSLGLAPYLSASVLVLLLSGLVPALRRLRDGSADSRVRFDRVIYGATAVVAFTQAWGFASFVETLAPTAMTSPAGLTTRILIVGVLTTGALFAAFLADQISARGIANGIAIIVGIQLILEVVQAVAAEGAVFRAGGRDPGDSVVLLLVATAIVVVAVRMVTAKRHVPLTYESEATMAHGGGWTPSIGLRVNSAGIIPIVVAETARIPLVLAGVLGPGSVVYWVVFGGFIVLFVYVWTAITFSGADVVQRVARYGFRPADATPVRGWAEHLDGTVARLVAPFALFAVGLALVPVALTEWLGVNVLLAQVLGPPLLVLVAIGAAVTDQVRAMRERGRHGRGEGTAEWVPVFQAETDLEGDLVRGLLGRAGIPAVRSSSRVICVTGTLAFWEVCRPPLPSLTIHRRLGAGHVSVEVPVERLDAARGVVASVYRGATGA